MVDIELVIKIPEEDYEYLKSHNKNGLYNAILNGIPLPKGHDRLIYAKDVGEYLTLADVPTIIEADASKMRKGVPLEENDDGYNCENWIP